MTFRADWTTKEIADLREHAPEGAAACARALGRSVGSVKAMAHRLGISLRRPGCRRGSILGQPRGVSLRREVRETLIHGRRDELVAERMRLEAEAELCPACGYRPVRTGSGFCTACATERMVTLYEEITADAEQMRRLWAARQRRRSLLDQMDRGER